MQRSARPLLSLIAALCFGTGCMSITELSEVTVEKTSKGAKATGAFFKAAPSKAMGAFKKEPGAEKQSAKADGSKHWTDHFHRVKPWERDVLAKPHMGWDPNPLISARNSHIYFSKEGALVGGNAGGGGCGCN